jgi:hypothetical protein
LRIGRQAGTSWRQSPYVADGDRAASFRAGRGHARAALLLAFIAKLILLPVSDLRITPRKFSRRRRCSDLTCTPAPSPARDDVAAGANRQEMALRVTQAATGRQVQYPGCPSSFRYSVQVRGSRPQPAAWATLALAILWPGHSHVREAPC